MSSPCTKSAGGVANSPTGVRWRIAALLFAIVVLTFLDRMNMSVAARYIQLEFRFNNSQIGWILSAYAVGYALFQIPAGLLGTRSGPPNLLSFAGARGPPPPALTPPLPRRAGPPPPTPA